MKALSSGEIEGVWEEETLKAFIKEQKQLISILEAIYADKIYFSDSLIPKSPRLYKKIATTQALCLLDFLSQQKELGFIDSSNARRWIEVLKQYDDSTLISQISWSFLLDNLNDSWNREKDKDKILEKRKDVVAFLGSKSSEQVTSWVECLKEIDASSLNQSDSDFLKKNMHLGTLGYVAYDFLRCGAVHNGEGITITSGNSTLDFNVVISILHKMLDDLMSKISVS